MHLAKRTRSTLLFLALLLLLVNIVLLAYLSWPSTKVLRVSFLDVGQGDSIFIEGPTGIQMLIDGGRDHSVLRELPKHMSFFDRSIDVVVATHPDADHIGGLPEVFERYTVHTYLSSGVENTTMPTAVLAHAVSVEPSLTSILARRGMRIDLGRGAYGEILYPDRDVEGVETNTASIVMRVVYGESEFMLTGDAPSEIESWIISSHERDKLLSDVLKAGHHGSRHSTSEVWLSAVSPEYVVISAGKDNSYGHPHEEVLSRVAAIGATLLSTIDSGTISFESDGRRIQQK